VIRKQMLDELRFVVSEIKRAPEAPGPKEHFEILVRQMTASERLALAQTLADMVAEAEAAKGGAL
jgi:hypothetical protein